MPNYLYNPVSDTFIDTKNLEKVDNSLIPDYLRPLLANSKFDAYYWKDSMKEIKTTGIFKNYTILKKSDNKQYRVKQIDNAFCTNWLVDDFYEARIPMECYALQVIKGTGGAEHSIEYIEYFSQGNLYF